VCFLLCIGAFIAGFIRLIVVVVDYPMLGALSIWKFGQLGHLFDAFLCVKFGSYNFLGSQ
jgi:hypothetical protein